MMYRLTVTFAIFPIFCCTATLPTLQDEKTSNPIGGIIAYPDEKFFTSAPNPQQRAEKAGYTAETHEAVTEDGYKLTLHRITGSTKSPKADGKPVVLLIHGLMDCSATWVIGSPEQSLGFVLADNGYDVWMGNVRGNRYSRKHKQLTTQDKEYWLFSWHEIGFYDLPAMIDRVLEISHQKKLMYVGHSQGTTAFFVMASLRTEYQEKIKAMFAFSPIAFMGHLTLPLIRILAPFGDNLKTMADMIGLYEFIPTGRFIHEVDKISCADNAQTQPLCTTGLVILASPGEKLLNETLLSDITQYTPAGASTRQLVHYAQLINTGRFCQYNHGPVENVKRYGSIIPPDYPLEKIKTPIYLHYGSNDACLNEQDLNILHEKLPNSQKVLVPEPSFTHIDFIWAKSLNKLLHNTVLSLMRKHTSTT